MIRTFLKGVVALILTLVLYIAIVFLHGSVTEYKQEAVEGLQIEQTSKKKIITDTALSVVIWNMGFAGLGAESDFFYETGGAWSGKRRVRAKASWVDKNLSGAQQFIQQTEADFYLLQEVDRQSRRSYYKDELDSLRAVRPDFFAAFAKNYDVKRVPVPVLEPWNVYGKVVSGLGTLSRFQPDEADRLPLPGTFPWATRIFSLDRCAARTAYPIGGGKKLVVYNIHNSAYDNGDIKVQQMAYLAQQFKNDYQAGHYVVAGGDWNVCPPYFRPDGFLPGKAAGYNLLNMDSELLPADWQWIYDPTVPTNRKTRNPYQPGKTFVTLIDFFLVSPNIRVKQVKGMNQDFNFSDHHPVQMEFELLF